MNKLIFKSLNSYFSLRQYIMLNYNINPSKQIYKNWWNAFEAMQLRTIYISYF